MQGVVVVGVIVVVNYEIAPASEVAVASAQDFFGCCHSVNMANAEFLWGEGLIPACHYVGQELCDGVALQLFPA